MAPDQPNQEQQKQPEEDPARLQTYVQDFTKKHAFASSRKARCEKLMRRKIAKTWAQTKKLKMVRRLMTANNEIKQAEEALQSLHDRLATTQKA